VIGDAKSPGMTLSQSASFGTDYQTRLLHEMLRVEAALALAQASVGVIDANAAQAIERVCNDLRNDLSALRLEDLQSEAIDAGNLAIPFVKRLTALVTQADAEAAKHVHFGATSQDIIDTAAVLVWQQDLFRFEGLLKAAMQHAASLARTHRDTPMIGRTWMQHALPITFGMKVAGWLDALMRHAQRLKVVREEMRVLQFGGATGSLASLGNEGLKVSRALAENLALHEPSLPWFGHRDRIFTLASVLVGLTGSLGKIAKDVSLMAQTEVAELQEAMAPGKGGSSTMPHKRNPVGCAVILTQSTILPGLLASLASALPQEHERALGGWQAEWQLVPQLIHGAGIALQQAERLIGGLGINAQAMRSNIDCSRGLVMSESLALALAPSIGKAAAHSLLERLSAEAIAADKSLEETVTQDPEVRALCSREEIAARLSPETYLGMSGAYVDRVLAAYATIEKVTRT